MKTAIVTGCSRTTGFGQHVARTLALAGFEVYATLRDVRRADDLKDWASKAYVNWREFVMSELGMSDWLQPSNQIHN